MRLILLYLISAIWLWSDITILSTQNVSDRWQIHYLVPPSLEVNQTTLSYERVDLNHTLITSPHRELVSVGLFLIDTSIPMKRAFTKGIKPTIKEIFTLRNDWDRWAIASFDSEMLIVGEYNQTSPQAALDTISVGGSRTELYRASLQAIDSLASQQAKRKFLFLFSDGEAEDNAYTYQEVIAKANESNVTIISFGYKDSIHLQSLRRIAEESGGKLYIAHKSKHILQPQDIADLNSSLHSDSMLSFDISLLRANLKGEVTLTLQITTEDNSSLSQNLILPVEKLSPPEVIVEEIDPLPKEDNLLYYSIAAIVLVLLLLLLLFRKKKEPIEEDIVEDIVEEIIEESVEVPEPIAYLLSASGSKEYLYKTHSSIGALATNDIVIEGEYISRHHATLDLKDGTFFLIDNNSSNGLYVNYEQIGSIELSDGDIISFGPYEVTFKVVLDI